VFGQHRHDLSCRGSKKLKNHPHPQNTAKTKEKITSPLIDTHPDQMRPVLADRMTHLHIVHLYHTDNYT
jgi:hypothetical protein